MLKGNALKRKSCSSVCLTLPLFPAMTYEDVQDVIDAVYRVIGKYAC